MLSALQARPPTTTSENLTINIPQILHSDHQTNTKILYDIPHTIDLSKLLLCNDERVLDQSIAESIGRALGIWTRSFHQWAAHSNQAQLRVDVGLNTPMRKLKLKITYQAFMGVLENFPELLEGKREILEQVRIEAVENLEREEGGEENSDDWGLIHGDLWTGK